MKPLDTERLTIRPVSAEDAAQLHALNQAPGVMTYLERVPPPIGYVQTKTIPERIRMAEEHPGYGLWLAFLKNLGNSLAVLAFVLIFQGRAMPKSDTD